MLNLTNKRANYLFLEKETVIALKMSTGNILPRKTFYYFVLLNYKLIYIFFLEGGVWVDGRGYQNEINLLRNCTVL